MCGPATTSGPSWEFERATTPGLSVELRDVDVAVALGNELAAGDLGRAGKRRVEVLVTASEIDDTRAARGASDPRRRYSNARDRPLRSNTSTTRTSQSRSLCARGS